MNQDSKNSMIETWEQIPWIKIRRYVNQLQKRIYLNSKMADYSTMRKLQDTLIQSWQARLLAVRKVTQENQGKKTAGIDGVKELSPKQRYQMAKELQMKGKAQPVRRVWIPKPGTEEKRPLGIPTMHDRALQMLMKFALEPEWEARFEPNSYGFRPGRNGHDAIAQAVLAIQQKPKYVLDADIAKCFDRIDHQALLNKLGYTGKIRRQIKEWLKAGNIDNSVFEETPTGTPQGGVISPLFANVALHGLENMLKEYAETLSIKRPNGTQLGKRDKRKSLTIIRYADDFIVMHESLEVVLKCKEILTTWLKPMGLELKDTKTRIRHTLYAELSQDGIAGFDFLGFHITQRLTKYHSGHSSRGKNLGFQTIVLPSRKACQDHQNNLKNIITKNNKPEKLIAQLNPVITGWTNYFAVSNASTFNVVQKQDYLTYLKLRRWSKHIHGSAKRGFLKYWSRNVGGKWKFKSQTNTLITHTEVAKGKSITHYVKVKGECSPFDGNTLYWASRMGRSLDLPPSKIKLLRRCGCKCPWCLEWFQPGDRLEVDHIIPKWKGGKNTYTNLQLLHKHCHELKTKQDGLSPEKKNKQVSEYP